MTSQRFSSRKPARRDFLRALGEAFPFALLVALPLIWKLPFETSLFLRSSETASVHSAFGLFVEGDVFLVTACLVAAGVLLALRLFAFCFRKNSVNVFFSAGLLRKTLYRNRVLAGLLALAAAILVPLSVDLAMNVASFGGSAYVFKTFLYLVAALFAVALSGFSIGVLVSTVSGHLIEAAAATGLITAVPQLIVSLLGLVDRFMLKGNALENVVTGTDNKLRMLCSLLSPYGFLDSLGGEDGEAALTVGRVIDKGCELSFTRSLVLPVCVWFVLGAGLLVAGAVLFRRRKVENAGSVGLFALPGNVIGTAAFLFVALLLSEYIVYSYDVTFESYDELYVFERLFYHNAAAIGLCLALAGAAVFCLVQFVVRRNVKRFLKTLPVAGCLVLFTVLAVLSGPTGHYGAYNRLPAHDAIQSVSFHNVESTGVFTTEFLPDYSGEFYAFESDADSDVQLAEDLFTLLHDAKPYDGKSERTVCGVSFRLKDGTQVARTFTICDRETQEAFARKLFDSEYMDRYLQRRFLAAAEAAGSAPPESGSDNYNEQELRDYLNIFYTAGDWYLLGGDGLFNGCRVSDGVAGTLTVDPDKVTVVDDKRGLFEALCADYSAISYDEVYTPADRPLAILTCEENVETAYSADRVFAPDGVAEEAAGGSGAGHGDTGTCGREKRFDLTPQMTHTLAFLKTHGYTPSPYDGKVKSAFVTTEKLSLSGACGMIDGTWQSGYDETVFDAFWKFPEGLVSAAFVYSDSLLPFNDEGRMKPDAPMTTRLDLLKTVYSDAGSPLEEITDPKAASALYARSFPFYDTYGDDGRYLYVVFDDSTLVSAYLPASAATIS